MTNALRIKQRAVLVKEETTEGVDASPTGSANAIKVENITYSFNQNNISTNEDTGTLDVSPDLLRRQVTLIGSWTFSAMGMQECAEFIAKKRIPLERIFSDRWRLEQAPDAYRKFDTQTTGKGVFLL